MATPDQLLQAAQQARSGSKPPQQRRPGGPSYSPEAKMARQQRRADAAAKTKPAVRAGTTERRPTDPLPPKWSPPSGGSASPSSQGPPGLGAMSGATMNKPGGTGSQGQDMPTMSGGALAQPPMRPLPSPPGGGVPGGGIVGTTGVGLPHGGISGGAMQPQFPGFKPMPINQDASITSTPPLPGGFGGGLAGGGPQGSDMGRSIGGPQLALPPTGLQFHPPGGGPQIALPHEPSQPMSGMGGSADMKPPAMGGGMEPGRPRPFESFGQIGANAGGAGVIRRRPPMPTGGLG